MREKKLDDISIYSRRRRVIGMNTKMEIIMRSEKGEKAAEIARSLGMPRTSVVTIIRNKDRFIGHSMDCADMHPSMLNSADQSVGMFSNSHSEELSEQDLEVGSENVEDENAVQAIVEPPPCNALTMERLSTAMGHLESAMALFAQNDANRERSSAVNGQIYAASKCYRELYAIMKKEAIQTSMHSFLKRMKSQSKLAAGK